jgi:DNA-binding PadR family transcriptional regulator
MSLDPGVNDLQEARASKETPLKYVLLAGINNQPHSGYELTKWMQIGGQHC